MMYKLLVLFVQIPEEARELEKQPRQVTKESMSLCEAKYLRRYCLQI